MHQDHHTSSSTANIPAIDGLKALAVLLIFLNHSLKGLFFKSWTEFLFAPFRVNGWIGVILILVISGFLTTRSILNYKDKNDNQGFLKIFLLKRGVRILPSYYLYLIIATFLILFLTHGHPSSQFYIQIPLLFGLAGNWSTLIPHYLNIQYISHLWTVSFLIQAYLIWILLLFKAKSLKSYLILTILTILASITFRYYLFSLNRFNPNIYTNTFSLFEPLAVGGLLAILAHYKVKIWIQISQFIDRFYGIFVFLFTIVFLFLSFLLGNLKVTNFLIYTGLTIFAIFLLIPALNPKTHLAKMLSQKYLVRFGQTSLGFYLWQFVAIELAGQIFSKNTNFALFLPTALLINILFGFLATYLIERKLQKRLTRV